MERKRTKRLIKITTVKKLIRSSKKIILPGLEGLSLYLATKFFLKGIVDGTINTRASSLAFSFFLALFPTIIFLFTLIPYIPIDNFQEYLFNLLQKTMPKAAFEATEETIYDIISNQQGGLLSFGFLTALFFSSNGFNAMINSFNETYHEMESRNLVQQRLVSLAMLLITVLMLSVSIAILIYGEFGLTHFLKSNIVLFYLLHFLKWIILFSLCYSIVSINYFLGPKRKQGWRFFSAGSMFATILIIIATLGFSFYVNSFGNYNKLYGSIGTLIVIMLLIYINSLILLLGFDLNASIHSAKKHHLRSKLKTR